MRLRLLVVAAFVAMAAVPAFFAYRHRRPARPDAGLGRVLRRDPRAPRTRSPRSPGPRSPRARRDRHAVLWEQRDPDPAVAGLWSYDVRTQVTDRVLGRPATGKSAGFPSASGDADRVDRLGRPSRRRPAARSRPTTRRARAAGPSPRRAAPRGRRRAASIWVEDGAVGGNDAIRGSNTLTDEEYSITADGERPRPGRLGQLGRLDRGARQDERGLGRLLPRRRPLPARRHGHRGRHRPRPDPLGRRPWGATRPPSSRWDRHSSRSTVLCRVAGTVSSLLR